jgi:hypothetical protein
MKKIHLLTISLFCLLISCSRSDKIVASIDGEPIYFKDIFSVIDESDFNKRSNDEKKSFIRSYAANKILLSTPQQELDKFGFSFKASSNRLKNKLIIKNIEKYIFKQLVISDSILDFIINAVNMDIYVKAVTVNHRFSFGKTNPRTKKEALNRAEVIYNRLLSNELTYEEALSIYSESTVSKIKGNEMGQLYYGLMPKKFNDAIWTSTMGYLHKPLETPIGFHVVIVDHRLPKLGSNKRDVDREKMVKDLKKGKYGFQEENFIQFVEELYEKYDVSLNQDELYNAWDSLKTIDGVNTMSGVSIDRLAEVETSNILAKINGSDITLGWIINETENYSFYKNISVNNGFSFYKLISDVVARHLMLKWYKDNKENFPDLDKTIKYKSIQKINTLYFDKMEKLNPDLTKEIIMNRFMLEKGVVINSELFAEDF